MIWTYLKDDENWVKKRTTFEAEGIKQKGRLW